MGDRLAMVLSAIALVFLAGVVYVGRASPSFPAKTEYALEIQTKAAGDVIHAEGATNLPDGARLLVYVDRLYRFGEANLWSAARVGEAEALVNNGRWQADVPVDDEDWVIAARERLINGEFQSVEAVQSTLRTTALFSPIVPQSAAVLNSMGTAFEALGGSPQAIQEGEAWMLRGMHAVEKPLRRDLEAQLTAAGEAMALRTGES